MNHEVAMGVLHGVAYRLEELQAGAGRETPLVAVLRDRLAGDVFHDEEGHAALGRAAVQETRDVRMLEARQDLALGAEAGEQMVVRGSRPQQLDRDLLLVLVVGAGREVDGAHPALAQLALEAVRSRPLSGQGLDLGFGLRDGDVNDLAERPGGAGVDEERLDLPPQVDVVGTDASEERAPLAGVHDLGGLEELLEPAPAFGSHSARCASSRCSHAFASRSSRWTVAAESPVVSAISS